METTPKDQEQMYVNVYNNRGKLGASGIYDTYEEAHRFIFGPGCLGTYQLVRTNKSASSTGHKK